MPTFHCHSIGFHRIQHLIQFLFSGHVLHLTQVELLKFHWDISCLKKKSVTYEGGNKLLQKVIHFLHQVLFMCNAFTLSMLTFS